MGWRVVVCLLALLTACHPAMVPGGLTDGTHRVTVAFTVQIGTGTQPLHVQAVAGDIDHLTAKLVPQAGETPPGPITLTAPFTGTRSVSFGTVGDGSYKLSLEAFATAGDTVSLSKGGPLLSSNVATISGINASFDLGSQFAFAQNLQLITGGDLKGKIVPSLTGTNTMTLVSAVDGSVVLAPFDTAATTFTFRNMQPGSYNLWASSRNGVASTISRKVGPITVGAPGSGYAAAAMFTANVAGTVRTVVGGGVGDGAFGIQAAIGSPVGITRDSAGNTYVADVVNVRVRKIDGTTGAVSTVAGTGQSGTTGDGGPATAATFKTVSGLAIDGANNLYIADNTAFTVRQVNLATGIIKTFAGNGTQGYSGDGGAPTGAQLTEPSGLTVDDVGNLVIADGSGHAVRMVCNVPGTYHNVVMVANTIYTVAGTGVAAPPIADGLFAIGPNGIDTPRGVAYDAAGNLWIALQGENRVRRVDTGGRILTVAGDGTALPAGDGAPATAAGLPAPKALGFAANQIFIATDHRIRAINLGTNLIATVAGDGTATFGGDGTPAITAQINDPQGVCADGVSNIYIADTGNSRIRKVNKATLKIGTLAGTGSGTYGGDNAQATNARLSVAAAVVVATNGDMYVADRQNHRVRLITAADGIISTFAGTGVAGYNGDNIAANSAQLNGPGGLALDGNGNLYIADTANNRIRKVVLSTGKITTVAGTGNPALSGDGGPAINAELQLPLAMAIDPQGNVYIADTLNNVVRKLTVASGKISAFAGGGGVLGDGGPATSAQIINPTGLALDQLGNLYISDIGHSRIRKVLTSGKIITVVGPGGALGDGGPATSANLNKPGGLVMTGGGDLYIADKDNSRLRKVVAGTGVITTLAGDSTFGFFGDGLNAKFCKLNAPLGLAIDATGNVYIADSGNGRIRVVE